MVCSRIFGEGVKIAYKEETKSDLANKTMKDLRRTIKSGEELFRNSKLTLSDQAEVS
jgi:hypothetical protein